MQQQIVRSYGAQTHLMCEHCVHLSQPAQYYIQYILRILYNEAHLIAFNSCIPRRNVFFAFIFFFQIQITMYVQPCDMHAIECGFFLLFIHILNRKKRTPKIDCTEQSRRKESRKKRTINLNFNLEHSQ